MSTNGKTDHAHPVVALEDRAQSLIRAALSQASAERQRWAYVEEEMQRVLSGASAFAVSAAERCEALLLAHRRNQGMIFAGVRAIVETAAQAAEGDRIAPPADDARPRQQPADAVPPARIVPRRPDWWKAAPPSKEEVKEALDAYVAHAEAGEQALAARDESRPQPRRPDSPPAEPTVLPEDDPEPQQPQTDPGPAQAPSPAENAECSCMGWGCARCTPGTDARQTTWASGSQERAEQIERKLGVAAPLPRLMHCPKCKARFDAVPGQETTCIDCLASRAKVVELADGPPPPARKKAHRARD